MAVIQAQNFVVVGLAAIGGQNHEEFDEGAVLCSGKESCATAKTGLGAL